MITPDDSPLTYRVLTAPGESIYKEQRSKFLAFAHPVSSQEEVDELLSALRRKYNDARHICWGYTLGIGETQEERCSDDGEPSSTAGKPILGQIKSRCLCDTLVAVVRYFGGVKLGTGGLIVAYRTAASDALDEAVTEERAVTDLFALRFPFDLINPVMMLLRQQEADTLATDSDVEGYRLTIRIKRAARDTFLRQASTLYRLTVEPLS